MHYNIRVKGKVQGVRYRVSIQAKANKLLIHGYVKNLDNGDVYIEAEGKLEQINALIDWCYIGSPLSKVTEVESEEGDFQNYKTFEVRK